jgi:hypothetical protein
MILWKDLSIKQALLSWHYSSSVELGCLKCLNFTLKHTVSWNGSQSSWASVSYCSYGVPQTSVTRNYHHFLLLTACCMCGRGSTWRMTDHCWHHSCFWGLPGASTLPGLTWSISVGIYLLHVSLLLLRPADVPGQVLLMMMARITERGLYHSYLLKPRFGRGPLF